MCVCIDIAGLQAAAAAAPHHPSLAPGPFFPALFPPFPIAVIIITAVCRNIVPEKTKGVV